MAWQCSIKNLCCSWEYQKVITMLSTARILKGKLPFNRDQLLKLPDNIVYTKALFQHGDFR